MRFQILVSTLALTLLIPLVVKGATVLFPPQGGTGIGSALPGDVGNCLKLSDDSPFTWTIGTCGTGGGGSIPDHMTSKWATSTINTNAIHTAGALKVGIGTTSPSFELGVQGNALISATTTTGNLVATSSIYVAGNINCTSNPCNFVGANGASVLQVDHTTGTDLQYGSSKVTVTGGAIQGIIGGFEIARINANGFGVGSTSPSANLAVVGRGIITTSIAIGTTTTAFNVATGDPFVVQGSGNGLSVLDGDLRGRYFCASGTGNCYLGTEGAFPLILRTTDTDQVTILANGNTQFVGDIKTDTDLYASSTLAITGLSVFHAGYIAEASSTVVGDFKGSRIGATNLKSASALCGDADGFLSTTCILSANPWTQGTGVIYLTINSDKVGIGTISPTNKLEVRQGNVLVGATTTSGDLAIATTSVFLVDARTRYEGRSTTTLFAGVTDALVFATSSEQDILTISTAEKNNFAGQVIVGNATNTGPTFPIGKLTVNLEGDRKTTDNVAIFQLAFGGSNRFQIHGNGHTYWSGLVPTLSACDTGAALDAFANDMVGQITVGTGGAVTSCTVTWANGFTRQPTGFATDQTQIIPLRVTTTTTTGVIDATVAISGDVIKYFFAGKL